MDFDFSPKVTELSSRVDEFMHEHVFPNEAAFFSYLDQGESRWVIPPIMEDLKQKAREAGLWNLFLPESDYGAGLSNLEYAPLAELMGRSAIGSEVFRRTKAGMAGTAAARRNTLRFRDDRTRRGFVGCHQYPGDY
jgi:acyl-CoA dehydrogenase